MNKNKNIWTKWLYWFSFSVAVIGVYKTLDSFSEIYNWINEITSVIMPFLLGILVAYLLYLPARKIETLYKKAKFKIIKNKARTLAVFTTYIIVVLLIIIIINFIIPAISESIADLAGNFKEYYNSAVKMLDNIPQNDIIDKLNLKESIKKISEFDITSYFNIERVIDYIKGVMGVASTIFSIFVTIVVSIYILLERGEILAFLKNLTAAIFDNKKYKKISRYFYKTNEIFFKFLVSQLLDAIVVGILTSIAMILLKVKYAVLLGFMIGLFNIIPYFGAIIAVILAIIITMFTGGISKAVWLAIIIIILQQIDANIINPKIVGNSLKLSPLLVIFAVTIGGAYFGILGMFLAVPVIAVLKIVVLDYIEYKNNKRKIEKKRNYRIDYNN